MGLRKKKRRVGRPRTGTHPHVATRLPAELLRWCEEYARDNALTLSGALRQFAERARACEDKRATEAVE